LNKILKDKIDKVFSKMVSSSIEQQNIEISPYAEEYVIELVIDLSSAAHTMSGKPVFINDLLRKGLNSEGLMRREYLRLAGDVALFVSGIFPDSLGTRRFVFTVGDFIDIGQSAYSRINNDVFDELAFKFPEVVGALNAVSVEAKLTSADITRYITRRRSIDARIAKR